MVLIYFDLDGVIRDLIGMITPPMIPHDWNTPIHGQDFMDYFDDRLHLLTEAQPTEYYDVIRYLPIEDLTIITSQPPNWQILTSEWIERYLPKAKIIFDSKKLHLLGKDDVLVEDYPKYEDYSKIILIDRPYNRCVESPRRRITSPEQLRSYLEFLLW